MIVVDRTAIFYILYIKMKIEYSQNIKCVLFNDLKDNKFYNHCIIILYFPEILEYLKNNYNNNKKVGNLFKYRKTIEFKDINDNKKIKQFMEENDCDYSFIYKDKIGWEKTK